MEIAISLFIGIWIVAATLISTALYKNDYTKTLDGENRK